LFERFDVKGEQTAANVVKLIGGGVASRKQTVGAKLCGFLQLLLFIPASKY
jgi:hypothetical protein